MKFAGEKFFVGKNFLLTEKRKSTLGPKWRTVITISGYTITPEALEQNWLLTQLQTVPKSDRSHLPDPFILSQKLLPAYEKTNCNVFNLFFLPECKGLKYAMEEFAKYLEADFSKTYPEYGIIGYSKGGLFAAGLVKYLKRITNILMITPTFGTIMGDEEMVSLEMDKYLRRCKSKLSKMIAIPQVAFLKKITHITCSRRPIDYDMTLGSKFLDEDLDVSKLRKHNAMLITVDCFITSGISERFFKYYAKFVGLDKHADGMVEIENQRLVSEMVKKEVRIFATHPTALEKSNGPIEDFILSNIPIRLL